MIKTALRATTSLIILLMASSALFAAPAVAQQQDNPAATTQAHPALFSDSFDSTGDLSLWSGDSLLKVEQQAGYQETYGAHGSSSGAPSFAESRLSAPVNEIYARIRFSMASRGDNPVVLMRLRSVTGPAILSALVSTDGTLGYTLDGVPLTYTSTQPIALNTWYELQIHLRIAGNDSAADAWLNNAPVPELSQRFGLEVGTIGRIEIGDNSAGRTWDARFDDVIASTAQIAPEQAADPISGTLTVRTTPKLPGLQFVLDGQTFLTDANGIARITVANWSADMRERIQVPSTQLGPEYKGAVASFWTWNGWLTTRDHDVNAFFDLSYPLQLSFVDQLGNPVDMSGIDSVTLQNSVGKVFTLTTEQLTSPQLLPASRVVPSRNGRVSDPFEYSVVEVNVRGSNVVNRGQQRFKNTGSPPAPIKLLLFSATITVQDALFGKRTGNTIEVQYPDGKIQQFPLDENHSAFIPLLARGDYTVKVIGAGYSPPRPVTLSRDQIVQLEVVTKLDVAVIGGLIGTFLLGLLFAGRPGILLFPYRVFKRFWPRHMLREVEG